MQLDCVEILRPDAGFLVGGLRRGRRSIAAFVIRQAIDAGAQRRSSRFGSAVLLVNFLAASSRADDRRRGAVGNRRAHVKRERIDHDARLHDLLDCQRPAMLRQRIERAVGGVLHCRLGKIARSVQPYSSIRALRLIFGWMA